FRANTPGEWLFPDQMEPSALAAVIRNCPSGALTYETRLPELAEAPSSINTVRLRENGPYAFSADLRLSTEQEPVTRRTLCRCGASKNNPYCDSSHSQIGFTATGEPASESLATLAERGGPLEVTPLPNGPLQVRGALEVLSGTGRAIARTETCRLCRCGGSKTKPFCDGTHAQIGFTDASTDAMPTEAGPVRGVSRPSEIPTLAAWLGGRERAGELTRAFYARVPGDLVLGPVFAKMNPKHAEHVADFITEVFGGAPLYSESGGSHSGMVGKHMGRNPTQTTPQSRGAPKLRAA